MKLDRVPVSAGVLLLLSLLVLPNGAQASGTFQRTMDKKAIVWNTDQQPGDEAEWSGGTNNRGYAEGSGTITWYKLDRVVTGTSIPSERGHSTVIATYTGRMVNGMFNGQVETVDANGEKVHATFARGRRKTGWAPGPASATASKGKKAAPKTEETPAREAAATTPTVRPAKTERIAETKTDRTASAEEPAAREAAATTPTVRPSKTERIAETRTEPPPSTGESDSAQSLTGPPSSMHVPDSSENPSVTPVPAANTSRAPSSTRTPPPLPSPTPPPSTPPPSAAPHPANAADDAKAVAALDKQYQAAVKANDVATMDRILAEDFVLVNGRGRVSTKADLLKAAREKTTTYENQDEEEGSQKVRVWGDTAVVTALLSIKGTESGSPVDYQLWFSDTYARVPGGGWRYVFGQASRPLLKAEGAN